MEMTDRYIVAIDLGTSKLSITVAKVIGRDVQIVYYKESPSAGIRYRLQMPSAKLSRRQKKPLA